jgi:hypothetical protein
MKNTNKKPETIGEWLDWAEEQGYDWAKEAREETLSQKGVDQLNINVSDITDAVAYAFYWTDSKKGHYYWDKICWTFYNA